MNDQIDTDDIDFSEQAEAAYFGTLGAVTIVVGAALLVLSPWIRRMMRGVR